MENQEIDSARLNHLPHHEVEPEDELAELPLDQQNHKTDFAMQNGIVQSLSKKKWATLPLFKAFKNILIATNFRYGLREQINKLNSTWKCTKTNDNYKNK